ncbi:DUF3618 domain-containing protein [Streptomyces millisiae]|uniref:DUF3618 domain-containing protein n=1 Tax=Streptomyces millisiae TaxID=3075542 RepID=A0ABU2LWP4_9ACTN|nr:DUF3618 domain-containing protein [Streptomyces sp. DSM 44918]MDT0322011.1 DUF3618 domain-containing protein [Streptomyces sp. DSM 44918]
MTEAAGTPATPADIEARIARRRENLARTLDEIGVRVHPSTIADELRTRAAANIDRTAGRALEAVNRGVTGVRSRFVTEDGGPRLDRVVPVALLTVAAVGLLVAANRRRQRG